MEILINKKTYSYVDIQYITLYNNFFCIRIINEVSLVNCKPIPHLTKKEFVSIYKYNVHRDTVWWFKQHLGFDKLPQEYKFMEM